ncbi:MAG: hypothetical protein E7328_01365 [Clostridiales bacterium]|nr:hypothetical protein [Clostridiales bacterium]
MAGFGRKAPVDREGAVEVKYPVKLRVVALVLVAVVMFCYALVLLGQIPFSGFEYFLMSTLLLLTIVLLCFSCMNFFNWRILGYRDRLSARKWNMDEREFLFSDLTGVWSPEAMDEMRIQQGRKPAKKNKRYCTLLFGRDFILVPMANSNTAALLKRVRSYCETGGEAQRKMGSILEQVEHSLGA